MTGVQPCECGKVPSGIGSHCAIHHADEPVNDGTYIVCYECGHVYQSSDDLVTAFKREMGHSPPGDLAPIIDGCMECGHDF
jgi:hypothetical protein